MPFLRNRHAAVLYVPMNHFKISVDATTPEKTEYGATV